MNQKQKIALIIAIFISFQIHASKHVSPLSISWNNLSHEKYIDNLVQCKTKLDELKWSHNLWPKENKTPKPPFSDIVKPDQIRKTVLESLKMEAVLLNTFNFEVTPAMLQHDLDRMAKNTKDPKRLKELFTVFNNDPMTIVQCVSRPYLVKKKTANSFNWHNEIHAETKALAESEIGIYKKSRNADTISVEPQTVTFILKIGESDGLVKSKDEKLVIVLDEQEFRQKAEKLKKTTFNETEYSFVYQEILSQTADSIEVQSMSWQKQSFHDWMSQQPDDFPYKFSESKNYELPKILDYRIGLNEKTVITDQWLPHGSIPDARYDHTAIWTGNEMIAWGGYFNGRLNTGIRYNPTTDSWQTTSTSGAPSARDNHTAVWTGSEMIVWGGYYNLNTGGRYDPSTDNWLATPTSGAPIGREHHTAIWTGTEMIIWGGAYSSNYYNSGGKYNPYTNSWQATTTNGAPLARDEHTAIWTGSDMIVWGGDIGSYTNSGGRYDPSSDSWQLTDTSGAPSGRGRHTAIWSGSEMIIWGGFVSPDTGGRYDPSTNSWQLTTTIGAPSQTFEHTAVWTGNEMIVWGGNFERNDGGRYNPSTDSWQATTTSGVPRGRSRHTATWTGNEMIIWGGYRATDESGVYLLTTRYQISGTLNGLSNNEVILQNNTGDDFTLNSDGNFTFSTPLDDGENYAVTVLTQPTNPNQSCMVIGGDNGDGTGTINSDDVSDIAVTCTTIQYDVNVSVSGLVGGSLSLSNGVDTIDITTNSTQTISILDDGSSYNINITNQPNTSPNQTCSFTSPASGILNGSGVTVNFECETTKYNVDINVSGLAGGTVSFSNGSDTLDVSSDGTETISTLDDGSAFDVDITTHPAMLSQTCNFTTADSGTLNGSDVTLEVECVTNQFNIDVSVSGLAGGTVSFSNGTDILDISSDGTQTISTLTDGSTFDVNITNQPTMLSQTCSITNADNGSLSGSDVTVDVECVTNQYNVDVSVSGLTGGTLSFSNGADTLDISADGTQTISTLDDGSAFDVDITAQPINPYQVCSFTISDSGVLNGGDVIITVDCVINEYDVNIELAGLATGNNISFANGSDTLTMTADGTQIISTQEDGSFFNVDITSSQPISPNQTCSFTSPVSGSLNGNNVTISVECITNQYNVAGNLTGLEAGNSLVVQNNLKDDLTLSTNGDFSFSTPIDDLYPYSVSVFTHPTSPNQTCDVFQGTGTINGNGVDNIDIVCSINTYFLGGNVSGLLDGNDLLLSNESNFKLIDQNGTYIFNTPVPDESEYDVQIYLQPSSPIQPCQVMNGTSTISGDDVTNIDVNCEVGNDLIYRNGFE